MVKLKKIPIRVWILIIVLFLAVLSINPTPGAEGIEINNVEQGIATEQGLRAGQKILSINGREISSLADYKNIVEDLENDYQNISLITFNDSYQYQIQNEMGFEIDQNLTIIHLTKDVPINVGEIITKINGKEIANITHYKNLVDELLPKTVYKVLTNKGEFAFLARSFPNIRVKEATTTNIKKGLDLEGGTRVLLKPISDEEITNSDISDLIKVLSQRLNIYGLSDLRIRAAEDWSNEKFILVEIAGASREEVKDLIGQQGRFEARVGDEVVFKGGERDIPFVCRNDGTCSGIKGCSPSGEGYVCNFQFSINLNPDAAKRFANSTKDLEVIRTEEGREKLEKNIDFYLDDKEVSSLTIGADLKGSETTNIAISGSGVGPTRDAAINDALESMDKLQTVLITGSLPFDLETVKLDSISPLLGQAFIKNSFLAGLFALLGISLVIFIRYRNLTILISMLLTIISELIIILGFAALIGWNLDIAAIAGIIAAMGTGVDDLIIIIDETLLGGDVQTSNWKRRLKNAFFIIFAAYATTVAALIPLWNAGAGLIRGFAITTIAGITIGVFITRPAFASIIEKILNK